MWIVSNGSVSAPTIMSIDLAVAHPRAPALRQVRVGRAAHALGAAADRGVGVAEQDVLRRADDRLQAAAAQAVQRQRAAVVRQAAVDAGDARQVHVLRLGVDDVAEHALADVRGIDLGAGEASRTTRAAELGRRDVLQAAAVVADGRAHTAQDDDFSYRSWSSPRSEVGRGMILRRRSGRASAALAARARGCAYHRSRHIGGGSRGNQIDATRGRRRGRDHRFRRALAYPDKPVQYIIPFTPGGESDIAARLQQQVFKTKFNQDLIVVNKPRRAAARSRGRR